RREDDVFDVSMVLALDFNQPRRVYRPCHVHGCLDRLLVERDGLVVVDFVLVVADADIVESAPGRFVVPAFRLNRAGQRGRAFLAAVVTDRNFAEGRAAADEEDDGDTNETTEAEIESRRDRALADISGHGYFAPF